MEISPYMLTLLLIYSFLFGMSSGVLNDLLKITRALFFGDEKKKSFILYVLLFFEDLLLAVFIGCGVVVLNYYLNRGQFRLYSVFAVASGFALYYFTVGKAVGFISDYIVRLVRRSARLVCSILTYPIKAIFLCIKKIFIYIVKKISFAIEKERVIRYNKKEREDIIERSKSGFISEVEKEV